MKGISNTNTLHFLVLISFGWAESDDIAWSPALVKARRVIESETIGFRAYCLKQVRKQCWFASLGVPITPSATILGRLHSQTSTLAPHHFPSYPLLQHRRATNVQIHHACRHSTPDTASHRSHWYRQVESIHQAHVVEMQGRNWCPECHFHHRGRWCSAHALTVELVGTISGFTSAFSTGVEAATLPVVAEAEILHQYSQLFDKLSTNFSITSKIALILIKHKNKLVHLSSTLDLD